MYANTISKFKKPIGGGMDRLAYYSKRHDLVFKISKDPFNTEQTEREVELYHQMTPVEKTVFPVVDVVEYHDEVWICMKKITPLTKLDPRGDIYAVVDIGRSEYTVFCRPKQQVIDEICEKTPLSRASVNNFLDFVHKYDICDIHANNLGCIGNQLCIIDAGL